MLVSPKVDYAGVKERVSDLLAEPKLEVPVTPSLKSQRKTKRHKARPNDNPASSSESLQPVKDIKVGIFSLQVVDNSPTVEMEVAHGSKLHIKPSDVLGLVVPNGEWRLIRVCLAAENGESLFEADRI
jgi:hypothetical protein